MSLLQIDWSGIFTPEAPLFEGVLRGTVIYFVVLVLLRLTPRRTVGSIAIMDLLVVVLIAEAAGKAMGDYTTLTEGIVLVFTLIGWSYVLNWLTYTVPAIERWVSPHALPVVRDGRLLRRNMRAEFLTEEELVRQLRLEDVEDLSEVKEARVEADGSLSVTKHEQNERSSA
jgi:uncharacterized membrane protein YcaP (DUF421 family)